MERCPLLGGYDQNQRVQVLNQSSISLRQSVSLNVTANCPHIGTGLPFSVPGVRRHERFTSRTAASSNFGKPLDVFTRTSPARPVSSTYTSRTTVPTSPARRDEGGYSGCVSGRRGSDFGAVRGTCATGAGCGGG